MFERSKASLAELEASLERSITRARGQLGSVRTEVESLDAGALAAFEGVTGRAQVCRAQAADDAAEVRRRLAALRGEVR
jgi:hypothetical protein